VTLLLVLLAATTPEGVVAGRVSALSGQPLPGAHVVAPDLRIGTATDGDGSFRLRLPAGPRTLRVSILGFRDTLLPIFLEAGETLRVDIRLESLTLKEQPVVVTAQRYESTAGMASVGVGVRSPQELSLRGSNGLEGLEALDLVQVDATSRTVANQISIRGASDLRGGGLGNRVLLLWNGRPANLPGTGGLDPAAFPLEVLAREEVVYGPHSALYGSHAVGGVIHLIPLSPWEAPRFRLRVGGGETRPVADWMITAPHLQPPRPWASGSLLGSAHTPRAGILVLGNTENDAGFAENRDVLIHRGYASLGFRPNDRVEIVGGLTGMVSQGGKPLPWRDVAHPLEVPDAQEGTRQIKRQWNADLVIRWRGEPLGARIQPYGLFHHQEDWPRGADTPQVVVDMSAVGLEAQVEGRQGIRHRWIAGLSLRRDVLASEALYGEHVQHLAALFAQEEFWQEKQILTAGLRYDLAMVDGSRSFSRLTPRISWLASPRGGWTFRTSLAQAFRAPTLAEMFLKRVLVDHLFFVQNPYLQPEVVTSAEVGGEYRTARGWLALTGFASFYRDLIDFFPVEGTAGLYRADNRKQARIAGVDCVGGMEIHRYLKAELAYEYLDARDAETGKVLAYRPRHQLHFRLRAETSRFQGILSAYHRSRIESAVFASEEPYLPGAFTRWDLRARVPIPPATIQMEITNLLNTRYELFARYPTPGRSWRLWLDFTF